MKRLYFSLLALSLALLSQTSFSQSLTATGINPVLGDVFNYKTTPHFNQGSSGSNQTWSFPSLTGTSQTLTVVSVASTPYASSYPSATLAEKQGSGTAYLYYSNSASAQQTRGYAANGTTIVYSNPEEMLHFPFSLGNSYTDYFLANFSSGGYNYTRRGSSTVTADASGTLTTPAGTFTNVIRVHLFQDYQDSTNFGGSPYIINYTNDQYLWYKDGLHYPLASTFTFINNGTPSSSGSYLVTSTIGIDENSEFASKLSVYPNPANQELNIALEMEISQSLEISLVNILGDKVTELKPIAYAGNKNEVKVNLENIPRGIYMAIIRSGNLSASRKIIVE